MQVFTFAPHTVSILVAAHRPLTYDFFGIMQVISLVNSKQVMENTSIFVHERRAVNL